MLDLNEYEYSNIPSFDLARITDTEDLEKYRFIIDSFPDIQALTITGKSPKLKKRFDDLPLDIKEKARDGNVFFTQEDEDYVASAGATVWYVYDQEYLLPVFFMSLLF